jgi:hypothetical protein
MPTEFAPAPLVRKNFTLSPEERLRHSLTSPGAPGTIGLQSATKIARARIAYNLSELSAEMLEEAKTALKRVFEVSPKAGFELYLQLLEYSTPKLKSMEMNVETNVTRSVKDMSLAELDEALGVVSVQHAPEPPDVDDLL